jgi:prolyl oligopeptidase
LVQIDFKTDKMTTVKLPFEGTVYLKPLSGISSNYIYSKDLYFGMESWDKELGIYEYNPDTKKVIKTQLRQQGKYGSIDDFIVKEIEVPSYDGALVPLSIIYLKNTPLNGLNPTILEGYGAYGITMDASFNLSILPWLKMGGIYAVAHVRGGGEKGELWHKGGYKSTKANSWKDFIACADYLIKQCYSRKGNYRKARTF